jgi:hypothetical protein
MNCTPVLEYVIFMSEWVVIKRESDSRQFGASTMYYNCIVLNAELNRVE